MERFERCLRPEEVLAFVSGAPEPVEVRAIESHLAVCADCRVLVSLVARAGSAAQAGSQSTTAGAVAPDDDAAGDPAPGSRVGRYVLRDRLGAGAMGVVFAAHDPELDRRVAVKLLRGEAGDAARASDAELMREAQAMAQLAHPNVVAVHDVGWFGDRVFLAMELVDGQTLAQWLAAARRPVREVIAMFVAAGQGLAAAHAAGLVHRDFKPENVLIGRDGRVRVTDFGLARRAELPVEPGATTAGTAEHRRTTRLLAGTPFYMAPEQLTRDRVDARSDQFSFCVAIYAALTGAHPFRRGGRGQGQPAARPGDGMPAWLWRVLRPGLAVDRELRYPALEPLLARLARGPRHRRVWLAAGLAAAATVAGVAGFAWLDPTTDAAGPTCEGASRMLGGAWDQPRARAIDAAFRATGRGDAGATFASASLLLDQYANRWIALRTDACRRSQGGGQPEAILRRRIDCLDARLGELRLLTGQLARASASAVDGAVVAVQSLGTLDTCSDDRALARPSDPDVAARPAAVLALDAEHRRSDFVRDADGLLWQVRRGPDGAVLGRIYVVDGVVVGMPAVILDADQHLQLLVRRVDGWLVHAWQLTPGGPWLGEEVTSEVTDDPTVILAGDTLVVFVRKLDGWAWRLTRGPGNGSWTETRVLDAAAGRPAAGLDVAGTLHSFVRKADGSLWTSRHPRLAEPPDPPVKLGEQIAGDPTITHDAVDKLTYYVRRTDGYLVAGYQDHAGSDIWHRVRLTVDVAGNASIAFDRTGRQICFIRKTDGSLWSAIEDTPSGGDWHEHILATAITGDPVALRAADDRVVYVVRKADGRLWQGEQDTPGASTWRDRPLP